MLRSSLSSFFFFNDTAPTEIYTLSLHDALPILRIKSKWTAEPLFRSYELNRSGLLAENEKIRKECRDRKSGSAGMPRPISYAVFCLKKKKKAQLVDGDPLRHRRFTMM